MKLAKMLLPNLAKMLFSKNMNKSTCTPAPQEQTVADFVAECEAFCEQEDFSLLTLSQKALGGSYAIARLPKMKGKIDERIARVREKMTEIAAAKAQRAQRK